jgi:hypothetical protein
VSVRCISGKRSFKSYSAALEALIELEQRQPRSVPGSCYQCPSCLAWHISSRKFTIDKPKGRGKKRRGIRAEQARMEATLRHDLKAQATLRQAWAEHFRHMIGVHESLAESNRRRLEQLLDEPGRRSNA